MITIGDGWQSVNNGTNSHLLVTTRKGTETVGAQQTTRLQERALHGQVFEVTEASMPRIGFGNTGQTSPTPRQGFGNSGGPGIVQSAGVVWPQ